LERLGRWCDGLHLGGRFNLLLGQWKEEQLDGCAGHKGLK
jgi:hypothetical protein